MSYWNESPSDEPTTIKGSEVGYKHTTEFSASDIHKAVDSLKQQVSKEKQDIKNVPYVITTQYLSKGVVASMYLGSTIPYYSPAIWKTYNSSPEQMASVPHTGLATQIPSTGVTDGIPNYFLLALSVLKNNLIKSLQAKGNETYRNWVEKTVANEVDIITQKLKGGEEVVG